MSYNQPPPGQPHFSGQTPPNPGAPIPQMPKESQGPKWARKRILIPAALVILLVGVGIGSSGGDSSDTTSAEAKPTVTVTASAAAKSSDGDAEPQPTVTVTKTVTSKAEDTAEKTEKTEAASGKVVFKVWGSAASGVDITYGSDTDSRQGSGLPMEKTLTLDEDALYYHVSAQLMGGGDINCSVTINGETKKGHASGGYNICQAQLNGGLLGGWE